MAKKKKNMMSDMMDDSMGIVSSGATLGVGSQVLGGIGGASSVHGQQALGNMSKYMPVMGTISGARTVLTGVKSMMKKKKKNKKKTYYSKKKKK